MVPEILKVDVMGETCPIPLIKARKAMRKADPGTVIEVIGDHSGSKIEIPMAVESLKQKLVEIIDEPDGSWKILIEKV
ncbi:MAG: sulfurtransferase TusA family protein [Candidatus Hodarchaeales archaeon]